MEVPACRLLKRECVKTVLQNETAQPKLNDSEKGRLPVMEDGQRLFNFLLWLHMVFGYR